MSCDPPFRFGALGGDRWQPHVYPGVWQRERTAGVDRLLLAPAGGHLHLLERLAMSMPSPYRVLHVLLASRRGRPPGRYEMQTPLQAAGLRSFLHGYTGYLERDGRHHTWIFGDDDQLVVYDNHDVLYCYGALEAFAQVAREQGLVDGHVSIPVPHGHHYNAEFDADEDRLFTEFDWIQFPLQPDDDR